MADIGKAMEVLGYYEWSSVLNPKALDVKGDRGGLTKYGIAQASHPKVDIANLTLEGATEIYQTEYWDRFLCGEIDSQYLATQLFLGVVNTNQHSVVMALQGAANYAMQSPEEHVTVDGCMGELTVHACNSLDDARVATATDQFSKILTAHYKALNQPGFFDGWAKRARWPFMTIPTWPNIDTHWRPL